jgi:hypothetical protein
MGRGHQVHWRYSGLIRVMPTKEDLFFRKRAGGAALINVFRSIASPAREASSNISSSNI